MAFAAAITLLAATNAAAQYTYTVVMPPPGTGVPIFRTGTTPSTNLVATSATTDAPFVLGDGILTPWFNYNQAASTPITSSFTGATQTLQVIASKNGIEASNGPQSLVITISGSTSATGNGAVTLTPGTVFFSVPNFVFDFSDGSTLTVDGFQGSNATGTAGNTNGADGVFGFSSVHDTPATIVVAPEPGSLSLFLGPVAALGTMGMVAHRRRRTA